MATYLFSGLSGTSSSIKVSIKSLCNLGSCEQSAREELTLEVEDISSHLPEVYEIVKSSTCGEMDCQFPSGGDAQKLAIIYKKSVRIDWKLEVNVRYWQ
ncbi:hypothetical protein E2C01_027504 [Portunus trituberculatus]|uniref:Uncharacterized protein n=1 Tax=Portunus trituberculatus TaxID=210409 RepID=A0A5B7EL09_PORTR|nr:hypothetical protein [Portunus trituberculatus]